MTPGGLPIFNVEELIDRSLPRQGPGQRGPAGGLLLALAVPVVVVVVVALLIARNQPDLAPAMRTAAAFAVFGLFITFAMGNFARAQRAGDERRALDQLEELVTLRRWPEAAAVVSGLLSGPMSSHGARVRALLYLSSVLSRYHQFGGAIDVHNYLVKHVEMDDALALTVRIARALAMLREDRLLDADRAIAELRRWPDADRMAGVALVELYRDVKTGHPDEAIALFERRRRQFGPQLAHRAADAFALAAAAYAARGDSAAAGDCWERATLLCPAVEVVRRYPELAPLARSLPPAAAPPEAA